ncbi:MAG: hypothetical protein JAZ06_02440 [Candidatus Thiodiazotropha taylori]|nr:hypothetical protein [Candidatus Thiodiazotropha taylori]
MTSNQIAISGIVLVLLVFAAVGFFNARIIKKKSNFLFAENIKSDNIAVNISATFSSLAGPFFFFMLQASNFGYMLIVLLAFQWLGHKYFLRLVEGLSIDPQHTGSIYRLIRHLTGSKKVADAANIIVAINTFFLLSIELILGSAVFAYFAINIPEASFYAFIALAIITIIYIVSGGFRLVFLTDKWQFSLVALGIVLALTSVFYALSAKIGVTGSLLAIVDLLKNPLLPGMLLFAFLLNTLATTFTQACVQVSSWQRIASADSYPEIKKGVEKAINRQFLLIWFAAIVIGAISVELGSSITGVGDIANLIKETGFIGEFIVFPLLMTGLVAALMSTADSHLISLMLSLDDFANKWYEKSVLIKLNGGVQIWFGALAALIGVALVGEYVWFESLQTEWKQKITQLMFAGYGQAGLLFPLIYAVTRGASSYGISGGTLKRANELVVMSIIYVALFVYWVLHWIAMTKGSFLLSQLVPVIGLAIVALAIPFVNIAKVASDD